MPRHEYDTWFAPLQLLSCKGDRLRISVPEEFFVEYIGKKYPGLMSEVFSRTFGTDTQYSFFIKPQPEAESGADAASDQPAPGNTTPKPSPFDSRLNPDYTFDSFVKGDSNKLAYSVALSIAENPGQATFNPFFLYGPSGVGKTHLATAIGAHILRSHPEKRVLFVSAHTFQTQYTDACSPKNNNRNNFFNFYQSIDVLIIDDVQELNTPKTQQTFFHIFNQLQQTKRQVIMTCDRPPAQFEGIEERMLTRFKWGMTVEIERPDIALRRAILKARIKRDGLRSISSRVVEYIAIHTDCSVRELQGIMNSIMAFSVNNNLEEIDIPLVDRILSQIVDVTRKELTPDDILDAVCSHTRLPRREVLSKSRKAALVEARQLTMYLIHKYTQLPYAQIGRRIGHRDHSTVMHACQQIDHRLTIEPAFRRSVEELEAKMKKN